MKSRYRHRYEKMPSVWSFNCSVCVRTRSRFFFLLTVTRQSAYRFQYNSWYSSYDGTTYWETLGRWPSRRKLLYVITFCISFLSRRDAFGRLEIFVVFVFRFFDLLYRCVGTRFTMYVHRTRLVILGSGRSVEHPPAGDLIYCGIPSHPAPLVPPTFGGQRHIERQCRWTP